MKSKQYKKNKQFFLLTFMMGIATVVGGLVTNGMFWMLMSLNVKANIAWTVFVSGTLGGYFTMMMIILITALERKDDK